MMLMKYPEFLQKNDLIGMTALSSGCSDCLDELKVSLNNLKKDYRVIVTSDVYGDSVVSASKEIRAREFNKLLEEDIKMIYIARGGDYLKETLDLIDFHKLQEKEIWIQGYSDPTSLLYILTTKYDIATIYGINGKGYDSVVLSKYQKDNLEIIKGNLLEQTSFNDRKTISLNGNFTSKGIIIGGCLDVLKDLLESKYDSTLSFINKYKEHGIVWYFDIFSMTSREIYDVLLKMKELGYFLYTDTYLFGTVLFKNEEINLTYFDAISEVLKGNIVMDANIGHVKPSFTIINGSLVSVKFEDDILSIKQEVLNEEDNG